jgi:hypothetical protein
METVEMEVRREARMAGDTIPAVGRGDHLAGSSRRGTSF